MQRPQEITSKLKQCDNSIRLYISELEKENARLQTNIAKYQVKNVSFQNEIKALKKAKPEINVSIQSGDSSH
jgi:chromosome segregation ATPase